MAWKAAITAKLLVTATTMKPVRRSARVSHVPAASDSQKQLQQMKQHAAKKNRSMVSKVFLR
jgi:hypothetical protein